MDTENSDIGGVDSAAHVEAAGQGDTDLGRQRHRCEIVEQLVHDRLDRARSVGSRGVAVDPALGVNDIGYTGAGTTDRETIAAAGQIIEQRLDLVLGVDHELDIVPGRETQLAFAMLIGNLAYFADKLAGNQASGTDTDRIHFITGLRFMHQDAGLNDLVPQPFPFIVFNDLGHELFVVWRTEIGETTFHRFVWIITHDATPSI